MPHSGKSRSRAATRIAVRLAAGLALVAMTTLPAAAQEAADRESAREAPDIVQVATLNWPPYSAPDLPQDGAVGAVVRAAFAQEGYTVRVRVWPWKRAIAKAKASGNDVVGYFPGYHCRHDPTADFIASDPLGQSPLGFAEHREAQRSWSSLADLTGLRLGTVVGYANTDDFDEAAAEGRLDVVATSDDTANLQRLLARRIDYAVIDKFVLAYLKNTDPVLQPRADEIVFDRRTLARKTLYLCFRADPHGRDLREIFNRGLAKLAPQAMLDRYIERLVAG